MPFRGRLTPNDKAVVVDGTEIILIRAERRAPALFGAGFMDQIPASTLKTIADEQARAADAEVQSRDPRILFHPTPVRGRVARLKDGRVGRFGWKGQTATLREFTLQACSNEIGLEVPGFPRAKPPWNPNHRAPGLDLSAEQCDQLVGFVASLPRPVVRAPETPKHTAEIATGKRLFAVAGCAVCHRPNLGGVEGIYSDLLLHDMGSRMGDSGSYGAAPIEPIITDDPDSLPGIGQGIKKEDSAKFGATAAEWRTPPLWGLRDSAPYMHDGRAATIAEAVALHDGEGSVASGRYSRLKPKDRERIELFLLSLAAPPAGS